MSTGASILHADLDAFFAAVEQRDHLSLRARPVIVGSGVVLAASYEARVFGVRSAMGGAEARRRCPHAAVVEPRFQAYVAASREVFAVFERTAPVVEGLSIDEAFLDVSGLERISGTPAAIAARLRHEVRKEVGLPITIGVARTKFLAKVASGAAKPDGLLVVEPGEELAFLHPLAVERVWGVGPATAARLRAAGITTVGEMARAGEEVLVDLLGRAAGRHLYGLAHNRDQRPVQRGKRRRSIGAQSALGRRASSPAAVDAVLVGLADRVGRRLRKAGRCTRTVILRLRFGDFARASRSRTLRTATTRTAAILHVARRLLADAAELVERRGLTLVGLSLTNLEPAGAGQLALPLEPGAAIDTAVDNVRERFGTGAITRAVLVGRGRPTLELEGLGETVSGSAERDP